MKHPDCRDCRHAADVLVRLGYSGNDALCTAHAPDEALDTPERALQRRLSVIWGNEVAQGYRYVPKASPGRAPGSLGWDVFDRKTGKFILSRKKIRKLTKEQVVEKLHN